MKIIALQGKSNCGKTTTLKLLIKKILNNNKFQLDSKYTKNEILDKCNSSKGDIKCVFEYNGKRIGITTRGDTEKALARDFKNHFADCDVVVCAIHTFGKTVAFVKSKGDVIIHSKWYVVPSDKNKKRTINNIQAEFLSNEIQTY